MSLKKLNYIGSKHSLLSFIEETIKDEIGYDLKNKKLVDVFSGTASVGFHFRNLGCKVISNDLEYYSYVVANAAVCCNYSDKLAGLIHVLNSVEPITGIFSRNYSEDGEDKRMFFTVENARKIDAMRQKLEDIKASLTEEEYFFLLASIIVSADSYANVPAIYGSFLKEYKKTAQKLISITPIHTETIQQKNKAYNLESINFADELAKVDIVYLDPPYNERQYAPNFHLLETIAVWDKQNLVGKTGQRYYSQKKSAYSQKKNSIKVFEDLIINANTKYIILSYNNEGIIPRDEILRVLNNKGKLTEYTTNYRRFRTERDHKKRNYKKCDDKVVEHLYIVKVY